MASKSVERREVEYQSLDEMMDDVRNLLSKGYQAKGNWNLSQSCAHVADWMSYPMDGYPRPGMFGRMMLWLMKVTVGPGMRKNILEKGFKPGLPTDPKSVPKADQYEEQDVVNKLQDVVDRWKKFNGQVHDSPIFGPMDKETAIRFHLLHASHHFGFLFPKP